MLSAALDHARQRQDEYLERLKDWLRIPSVSTQPEHAADVRGAASWVADYLRKLGFEHVALVETPGHPLVYAEWTGIAAPTLLVYGHFDVQPPEPLDKWTSPPFDPQVRDQHLYARGASDDKGQVLAILAALGAYLKTSGRLPVNLKLLLEGEEEVRSPSLPAYLHAHRRELEADAVLICDEDILDPQTPVILYGLRGNVYLEIEARGPAHDLHSGSFGGAVDNPLNVLARLIARLQDGETRRVLIPGFYDRVLALSADERRLIAQAPITEAIGLHLTGAPALAGEHGFSLAERLGARPTLEVCGLFGGYTGKGSKTVIPAIATAKLSMRIVPEQDPAEIAQLCTDYLRQLAPPTITLEVRRLGMSHPVLVERGDPAVQAAAQAYGRSFGAQPVFLRGGGSIPIVHEMIQILSASEEARIPIVLIGFGLPDGNTHAPNENLHLPTFYRGIETIIHYLDIFAKTYG